MATVDSLDRGDLADDFGTSYSIGLILQNRDLMLLAYQSQGFTNARINRRTGKIIKGKNTGEEWGAERVASEITQTKWYQSRDGNMRAADNARSMDRASWDNRVNRLVANIEQAAVKEGADLRGQDVKSYAERILRENFLDMQGGVGQEVPERLLNNFLAPLIKPITGTDFKGAAASTAASLRQKAEEYGVTFSDQWYVSAVQQMKSGAIAEQDLVREIVTQSKSRYAGIGSMISDTRSVKDLADPYMQLMASVLERNPAEMTMADPDIQSALQFTDPASGQTRTKSLWEFEQELRQKPEWGNTREGRRQLNNGAMSMLKSFGFYK